ncbi:hypothetical protein EI94DRAFT_1699168 [Lactarius quietus]|nr:hypothetical protein EI94DRAFT_1699168 [Lactarius quietus]
MGLIGRGGGYKEISSLSVLEGEQASCRSGSDRGLNADLFQYPFKTWLSGTKRDGRVALVEVICCERISRYLRLRSYIYIYGETGGVPSTADYPTYVQILMWFIDSPSTLCPFSVHRMALEKQGTWGGRWTVIWAKHRRRRDQRKASQTLAWHLVAVDGQVFQTDVYSASQPLTQFPRPRKLPRWGGRGVVVLIGIRLGIDGVNPIYYETKKRTASSTWTLIIHVRQFRYDHRLRKLMSVKQSVGPRSEGSLSPPAKQLLRGSPHSLELCRGGSKLSGAASDVGLDPTQVYSVTSYSGAELRTFHYERMRKMPLSGLDPSIVIGFRCKTEGEVAKLIKNHKMIFTIVDEPPSWSDADDSLESMSDPDEEEDDMPMIKMHRVRAWPNADVETREDEEEYSSEDFFDAGDGAVIDAGDGAVIDAGDGAVIDAGDGAVIGAVRLSSRAASESGQSGVGTEDDPVGPVTPSAVPTMPSSTRKATVVDVDFSRTISSDSVDLDDEEWVDPTPILPTPLEPSPPAFPPPVIAKSKSCSSTKSRKRKEHPAHVPFPSSVVEGASRGRRTANEYGAGTGWRVDAERGVLNWR